MNLTSLIQSIGCSTVCSKLLAALWAASLEGKIKHSAVEERDDLLWRLKTVFSLGSI